MNSCAPRLCPLLLTCQSKGLNDPFTGGLSSYGIVLMVAFALLQRDHFPPSPVEPGLVKRSSSDLTSTAEEPDGEDPEAGRPRTLSSIAEARSHGDEFSFPPSPGHTDGFPPSPKVNIREPPIKKKAAPSVGNRRQRFWQRSSLVETGGGSAGYTRATSRVEETQTSWDRCG